MLEFLSHSVEYRDRKTELNATTLLISTWMTNKWETRYNFNIAYNQGISCWNAAKCYQTFIKPWALR